MTNLAGRRCVHAGAVSAVVVGIAVAAMLAAGIGAADLLRFALFHALLVLGPGILLARALLPEQRGPLRTLVFGWALGYCGEMAAFAAAAAAGERRAILLWPLVAAVAFVALRKRGAVALPAAVPPAAAAAAGCLAVLLLVHLSAYGSDNVPLAPAPGVPSYHLDYPWNLSLAAEARQHWPVRDPQVSGEPLPYHLGWAFDAAAAADLTGVGLPEIVSRLQQVPFLLALAAGFLLAGVAVLGSAWAGVVGLALYLFVGDALGTLGGDRAGLRGVLGDLEVSPSFQLGWVLWLPLLVLVHERFAAGAGGGRRRWIALAALLGGCAAAKGVLLPVLGGGLGLLLAWGLLRERRLDLTLARALALAAAIFLASLATLYAGAGPLLQVDPLEHLHVDAAAVLEPPLTAVSVLAVFLAPLLGLQWAGAAPGLPLLVAVTASGIVGTLLLANGTGDEVYLMHYALVPGTLAAAWGLERLWRARPPARPALWVLPGLLLLMLVGGIAAGGAVDARAGLVLLAAAAGVVMATRRGLVALVAGLLVATGLKEFPWRYELRALRGAAPASFGVAGTPSGRVGLFTRVPLPAAIQPGLAWIRAHTETDAVLITPQWERMRIVNDFGYAGFAERRTVLGGTLYSTAAGEAGYERVIAGEARLFGDRERLVQAVYERCDAQALGELVRRHGATHLLLDAGRRPGGAGCARLGRTVFAGGGLTVVEVG